MKEQNHRTTKMKGVLWFDDRLVVPKDRELRNKILDEAHSSKLSIHHGSRKMYQDLKPHFWWTKMKKEIAAYVARCDLQVCCNLCQFQVGSGKKSTWISLLDFPLPKKVTIPYG